MLEPIGVQAIAEGVGKFLQSMEQMEDAFDHTSAKLDGFAPATGQAVGGTQKLGGAISSLLPSVSGMEARFGAVVGALGPIAVVAGVAVGGLFLLKKGFDALISVIKSATAAIVGFVAEGMQLAGRFQEMEIAALAVGRGMGLQEEQIRGAIGQMHDLGIRYDVAAKATASFAKNQIDLAKSAELVRIAQGAAILLGEDSSATMERLTWAITTHNTRMMRYMGIMVDFQAAQKRFAEANDRSVDSLTQIEKNMIAVNEAIRAGGSVAGIYEEAMKSPTKAMRSLTEREIPELKAALGAPFLQAWATVVNAVREFVNALREAMQEGGALYPILINLGAIASILADAFSDALGYVTDFISGLSTDLGAGFGDIIVNMARWGAEMVAALAEGIVSATSTVLVAAMNAIGSVLAAWLGPGSPAQVAPDLIKWGVDAMSEFLHGMTEADFSVLEAIQDPLAQVLSGAEFADISAEMIKALAEGGLDETMFARIEEAAGEFGTEIAELARLQYDLAMASEAVADAEKRVEEGRQKVTDLTAEYNQMVREGVSPAALEAKLAEINAAEEGLDVAKEEQAAAEERMGALEEEAGLQEQVVDQLIGLSQAAAESIATVAAEVAEAAAKIPKAIKVEMEAISAEDILPEAVAFDISSRISDAIDAAKAVIKEKLAYIFEPVIEAWGRMKEGPLADLLLSFSKLGLQVLEATEPIRTVFLAAVTALWTFLTEKLIPALIEWADVALPKVWSFVTTKLIPKLTELTNVTLEALRKAVAATEVAFGWLLDKVQELWSWVTDTFIPWVYDQFIVALEAVQEIVDKIKEAFEAVKGAIQKVVDAMEDLIDKAKEAAEAAASFLPGSPSPFEAGLRGAAAAMRQLSAVEMPRLAAAMYPLPAYSSATAAGGSTTTHSVTVPIGPVYINDAMDAEAFQIRVEQAVVRASKRFG